MLNKEIETYCPQSRADWRQWLEKNHRSKQSVLLVCNTKKSEMPTIPWSELVDEALCFGWIDSTRKSIDETKFTQLYSKRNPNSTWSKINKEKIQRLIADGLMTQAGLDVIEIAKQNSSWTILDTVEELIIPEDLEKAFKKHKGSKDYFLSLSKSARKIMLSWIVLAKRPETRQKRIDEIAICAGQKKKPKQF
ncbi:MAG: YdeI/OmpD-associated family protein [Chitinophagaceae bacterium]|nr:YdeI/OmpD-associated family protein [Chitinophagaceae bacterium]MCW5929711.1 YdeI/OmpD-associated family protein [Chitinophagaceae bacterium]